MPLFESWEVEAPAEPTDLSRSFALASGCRCPRCRCDEEVVADYRSAGLSLRAHPISFYRRELDELGITRPRGWRKWTNEAPVRVAGLVLLRQRPGTAKGITFVTLEDETGTVNLVVHQHTWDRYYRVARARPGLDRARPRANDARRHRWPQTRAAVIHVVVRRLEALAERLGGWR